MNSKIILLVALLCLSGCGVKSAPVEPKGSSVPSIEEDHPEMKLNKNSIYKSQN